MEIESLSIADIKAAYDFNLFYIKNIESEAIKQNIKPENIVTYRESKILENKLYDALLTKIALFI